MQTSYARPVFEVLRLLRERGYSQTTINNHSACYNMLQRHLEHGGIPFSVQAAVEWNESRKNVLSYDTYSRYRQAIFRLEYYLYTGSIDCPFCRSSDEFLYRLPVAYSNILSEIKAGRMLSIAPTTCGSYLATYKEFFTYLSDSGITEPSEITLEHLIGFWEKHCKTMLPLGSRQRRVSAITSLMGALSVRGDVPDCYQFALFNENAAKLLSWMKLSERGTAFHPSMELEAQLNGFLTVLDDWKYKKSSRKLYVNDLNWYFLFLELNHMEHSTEAVSSWMARLPEYPSQKRTGCSVKDRRCHTVIMFEQYLQGGLKKNINADRQRRSDSLPEWSRNILWAFVESRRLDGMANTTLDMCRSAGWRFFSFLEQAGISSPSEITPEIVKAFHIQDIHSTPESTNAYGIKLRQLLNYMVGQGVVSTALPLAVSTSCAPHRNIVHVLSDEMIDCIYSFRSKASTPLELRDAAILMLGLRMGLRSSDIIRLRLDDFNWKERTVTLIQTKTRKAITLPVPIDVGNSLYAYIINGRPNSCSDGDGYIFISHHAPYTRMVSGSATALALKRVLSAYGYELPAGQGFHITRKTFATKMLVSGCRLDDISNALGHARQETTEVYLERDEAGMRLCPLAFGGVLG